MTNGTTHIVLVKAWIRKNDKFLLAQRDMNEPHKPGAWSLPGGKVDGGERAHVIEYTLEREIEEEVGLRIHPHPELIYTNSFIRSDNLSVVNLTFLAEWESGDAQALDGTSDIKWLTRAELESFAEPEPWLAEEITALQNYLDRT